jgi:predicted transglutaminase-like cysteine proteinase
MGSNDMPPRYKLVEENEFVDVMAFNSVVSEFKHMVELEYSELKKKEEQQLKEANTWFLTETKKLESERVKRLREINERFNREMHQRSQDYHVSLKKLKSDGWTNWLVKQIGI